jgi:nucleotide-binding universal stress UspA family protein
MRLLTLKTVLVATDLDDGSRVALQAAKELAQAGGAELHVVHVSESPEASRAVNEALERAELRPDQVRVHVVGGQPGHAIGALGNQIDADVIVMGPHRKQPADAERRAVGSTALEVVTHATAPCLVAAHPLRVPLNRVVVAVDLSDTSRGALMIGLSWASALRAKGRAPNEATKLVGLYVHDARQPADPSALNAELGRVERDAGSWAGVEIESATTQSASAAAGIAEYASANRADLLVLGTRGQGNNGESRLGSVSEQVTQQLALPTLLVPPTVWATYAAGASGSETAVR